MLQILTDQLPFNANMFDCISINYENTVNTQNTKTIDYWVTEFPRNENVNPFQFVYGLFEKLAPSVFANNQDSIISLASELFADAKPLDTFESNVLDRTFKRLLMSQPTLSGRK